MKRLRILFLSIVIVLAFSFNVKAEFFSDIIVSGPNGIWTDSRAYATLNDAITAVGANQRTVVIVSPQTVTNLTVPANVTLKFERDGQINNSGQLTINTKNIIAEDRQIFNGTGDIDFATGSVLRSYWFASFAHAALMTADDIVTLIVSKPSTINTSCAIGNNVNLKWESPSNILTVAAGKVLSNIKNIEAGHYQLFAGAGDIDFLDGTQLNLSWFAHLRSVTTWVGSEQVQLVIDDHQTVDFDTSIPINIICKFQSGGLLTVNPGITLTYANSQLIDIGSYGFNPFAGTGTIVIVGSLTYTPASSLTASELKTLLGIYPYEVDALYTYGNGTSYTSATINTAIAAIGVVNKTTLLLRSGSWIMAANITIPANVTLKAIPGTIITTTGFTITINGPFSAGLYQVFSGTGTVSFGYGSIKEAYPEWWKTNTTPGITDMTSAIQAAITAMEGTYAAYVPITGGGKVVLSRSSYAATTLNIKTRVTLELSDGTQLLTSDVITMNSSSRLIGAGRQSSQILFSGTGHAISCDSSASPGDIIDVHLENFWLNSSVATTTNSAIFFSSMNHPTIIGINSTDSPTGASFIEIVRSALPIIRGLSLQGAAMGASPFILLYNDSDAAHISDSRFIGTNEANKEGIRIDNPGSGNSATTIIKNNSFEYFDVAIRVGNTASSTVSNVVIRENYFETTVSYEIVVGNVTATAIAKNVSIENNYFYSQATAIYAIYLRLAENVTIKGNKSLNHGTAMVEVLAGVKNFEIRNNNTADPIQQNIVAGATGTYDDSSGNIYYFGARIIDKTPTIIQFAQSPYTVLVTGVSLYCNATAGAITLNLPAVATAGYGKRYAIYKTDASVNAITVDPDGAETIDGAGTHTSMNAQWDSITIESTVAGWIILSSKIAP